MCIWVKKQLKSNKENNALPVAPTSDIPVQEGFQNELKTKKKDKKRKKKAKSGFISKLFKKIFNVKDNISKVTNTCKTAVSRTKKVGGWISKAFKAKPNAINTTHHLSTKDKIRKIIKEINDF